MGDKQIRMSDLQIPLTEELVVRKMTNPLMTYPASYQYNTVDNGRHLLPKTIDVRP